MTCHYLLPYRRVSATPMQAKAQYEPSVEMYKFHLRSTKLLVETMYLVHWPFS